MKNKALISILGIVIAIILVLYVTVFISNVTKLEGKTLTQTIEGNKTIYYSSIIPSNSDTKVIVNTYSDNEISVEFELPKNTFVYKVNFKEETNDKHYLEIIERENIVFDGYYIIKHLWDRDYKEFYNLEGVKVSENEIVGAVIGDNVKDSRLTEDDYKPDITTIIKFAQGGNVHLRGNYKGLFNISIILLILIIDIKYPRFFFLLNYKLSVNSSEPSEGYLFCQKIFRAVIVPIGIIYIMYRSIGF